MHPVWRLIWILLLVGLGVVRPAHATPRAGYWVDAHDGTSIADVRALPPAAFTPFDLDKSPTIRTYTVVWLRLELNPADSAQQPRWILEFRNRRIPDLQVFAQDDTRPRFALGFRHPASEQPIRHRYYAFPIESLEAQQAVYVRVELFSRPDLSLVAWEYPLFHTAWLDDHTTQAMYFGLALGLIVFNALLGMALRDRAYGFYVASASLLLVNVAITSGMGRLYVWDHVPWLEQFGNLFSAQLSIFFISNFVLRVLDLPTLLPGVARFVQGLAWFQIATLVGLAVLGEPAYPLALQLVGVCSPLFFPILGYCIWHRVPGALLLLVAFLTLLLGTLFNVLWSFGYFPDTVFSRNGSQIGSAMELLLLAFLLANRFARLQKAKLSAESDARKAHEDALYAERARVEALRESERMLESRVAERTAQLEETLTHLRATQENLIQAEKLSALGAMVAGVSHELNTPLGVIVTASSALGERTSTLQNDFTSGKLTRSHAQSALDDLREGSELIHRSAERAAELVRSFKQVAVDQVSERKRGFDLRQVVDENLVALRASLKCEPWPVVNNVPEGLDCDSFPGPLGQILTNLVMNAVYHGFANRPLGRIEIGAQLQESQVALWVTDDGQGMDARILARVFEPFFTTRLGRGGSGLGLSVSHRMASTLLQGELRASSTPNVGSTFTLLFARRSTLAG